MTALASTPDSLERAQFSASLGNTAAQQNQESKLCSLYQAGSDMLVNAVYKTASAVALLAKGVSEWSSDSNAIANTLRKLESFVFVWIEHTREMGGELSNAQRQFQGINGVIDFVQIFADFRYAYKEKWRKDGYLKIAAQTGFAIADTLGALCWLHGLGYFKQAASVAASIGQSKPLAFIATIGEATKSWPLLRNIPQLSAFAMQVGEIRLFAFVGAISLGNIAWRALMAAYTFMACQCVYTAFTHENAYQRTSAGIDFFHNFGELALGGLVFFQVVNPVSLGVVGATSIAFSLASFAYKAFHVEELKLPKQRDVKLLTV